MLEQVDPDKARQHRDKRESRRPTEPVLETYGEPGSDKNQLWELFMFGRAERNAHVEAHGDGRPATAAPSPAVSSSSSASSAAAAAAPAPAPAAAQASSPLPSNAPEYLAASVASLSISAAAAAAPSAPVEENEWQTVGNPKQGKRGNKK